MSVEDRPRFKKLELRDRLFQRRHLVPNVVTLGNMFCGFLTIIYSAQGRFGSAAIAIGIAILLDGLDGRVARRLNATSEFGVEFDSFSDLVSFGVAPAILMYHWCFQPRADEFGVLVCFVFALCAATRLARFNITSETLKSFEGLPTPGAAGMIAALVHLSPIIETTTALTAFGSLLTLSLAFLMVSKVKFFSLKHLKLKDVYLPGSLSLGLIIALIWYHSGIGFVLLASGYCLSGPVGYLKKKKVGATDPNQSEQDLKTKKAE